MDYFQDEIQRWIVPIEYQNRLEIKEITIFYLNDLNTLITDYKNNKLNKNQFNEYVQELNLNNNLSTYEVCVYNRDLGNFLNIPNHIKENTNLNFKYDKKLIWESI